MQRREFITVLGSAAAAWPFAVHAQQSDRMRRIGFLRTAPPPEHELAAFLRALAERDYVQGRNFVLVTQWGDGDVERLSELAVGLGQPRRGNYRHRRDDCCPRCGSSHQHVALVTTSAADPFMGGLIKSLSHPGGNVTGFASMERDISSKVFGDNEGNGPWAATHSSAGNTLDLAYVRSRTRCGRESPWHRIQQHRHAETRSGGRRHGRGEPLERRAQWCVAARFFRLHTDALSWTGLLNIVFLPFTNEGTILNEADW